VGRGNLRRQADGPQVEGVAALCCMTGFGRVMVGPTLLDLCGRMLRSVVEGTWVRLDKPPANSADNVDKDKWLFRVGPYAKIRTAQGGAVPHIRLTTFSL